MGDAVLQVGLYVRLSKEDLDKGEDVSESIKNQINLGKEFIDIHNNENWQLYDIYVDEDQKGSDRNRPEFNRLLSDAENHVIHIIACKTQARFCRDVEVVEKYLHGKFLEWGIRFIGIVDHTDTADLYGKKTRQINALKDQWYLEDLSDDIRRTLNTKRNAGEYIGSWALFGYMKDPENKNHLVIDPEAAEIVKLIYHLYIDEGAGAVKIANLLNQRGIDNPYTYKKKKGVSFNEGRMTPKAKYWNVGAIYSILGNQTYTGDLVQGRFRKASYKSKKLLRVPEEQWIIAPNTHEAIIDKETFERAQRIRLSKSRGRRSESGSRNIFSGKVYCLECRQIMAFGRSPRRLKNQKEKMYFDYLRCSSHAVSPNACIGASIVTHRLEEFLVDRINDLSKAYFDSENILERVQLDEGEENAIRELRQMERDYKRKVEENNQALKSIYLDKVRKIINEDEFLILKTSLQDEVSELSVKLSNIKEEIENIQDRQQHRDNVEKVIVKYRKIDHLDRVVIEELIDRIYVGHKDRTTGERKIEIIWNI